jgi:anti-sigma B factor antagonist
MAGEDSRVKTTWSGDVAVAELTDKRILDEAVISQIAEQLYGLVGESETPKMVVNFLNVSHMSSGALGMLITLHKRIREKGGELRLCNIRPSIYEVFAITRLNEVFRICETRDAAVGDLSGS